MRFSHSSLNVFLSCERKFAHRYIKRTPADPDYKEGHALNFGKAYHRVLENCKHDYRKYNQEILRGACMEFGLDWDSDGAKVAACLRSYFAGFDPEWKCTHTEIWWQTEDNQDGQAYHGQIDGIFEHISGDGRWRICDLKTSGVKLEPVIKPKLINDQQVCMYVHHVWLIAAMLGLDPDKFDGITYREVEKPRHRHKANVKVRLPEIEDGSIEAPDSFLPVEKYETRPETFEEFTQRCGNPFYRDTVVRPEEFIGIENIVRNFKGITSRAIELINKIADEQEKIDAQILQRESENDSNVIIETLVDPIAHAAQNMQACKQWGTPCQFWSQCYGGKTYTEVKNSEIQNPALPSTPFTNVPLITNAKEIIDDTDKF